MAERQALAMESNDFPKAGRWLRHGLPALIIGGALLIAAVWLVTLQLAGSLGEMHARAKMADVAQKARAVLQEDMDAARKLQALGWLARFRDVRRMELRDASGRLIWRNHELVTQVAGTFPAAGETVMQRRNVDGLPRIMARHAAAVRVNGDAARLLLEADVSALLASYRQVAMVVAKAITTALLAGILLMGWMIILRGREERALAERLRVALRQLGEGDDEAARRTAGQAADDDWREMLERLTQRNAALLRRMSALAAGGAGAAPRQAEGHVDEAAAPEAARRRA